MSIEDALDHAERWYWMDILQNQLMLDGERTAGPAEIIEMEPFQNNNPFYIVF
jgi:hypothetical protein